MIHSLFMRLIIQKMFGYRPAVPSVPNRRFRNWIITKCYQVLNRLRTAVGFIWTKINHKWWHRLPKVTTDDPHPINNYYDWKVPPLLEFIFFCWSKVSTYSWTFIKIEKKIREHSWNINPKNFLSNVRMSNVHYH